MYNGSPIIHQIRFWPSGEKISFLYLISTLINLLRVMGSKYTPQNTRLFYRQITMLTEDLTGLMNG
jgi:hypothetical protein